MGNHHGTNKFQTVMASIAGELSEVRSLLQSQADMCSVPVMRDMVAHSMQTLGKQIRPALVLLIYRSMVPRGSAELAIKIAASIELIHMASLIHDDIIDNATIRHGKHCIYQVFGGNLAIVNGVYLYALSLKQIANVQNFQILQLVSDAVQGMCEGEAAQISDRRNLDLDTSAYLDILERKTGGLFGVACASGAILAGGNQRIVDEMWRFGISLGMCFQLVDDVLDVVDAGETLGKPPGQDFQVGELTLPMRIHTNSLSNGERVTFFSRPFSEVQASIIGGNAISESKKMINGYKQRAVDHLTVMGDDIRIALTSLLDIVVERCGAQ